MTLVYILLKKSFPNKKKKKSKLIHQYHKNVYQTNEKIE